jgi:hypothetical protein
MLGKEDDRQLSTFADRRKEGAMHTVLWVLTLLCLVAGLSLILSPSGFTRVSKTMDKRYSTDNLAEILERYIDINERLLQFVRVIGVFALIVGVFLLLSVLKLP